MLESVHGGTDALGVPAHDFSTNRNACGPCPGAVAALQAAHAAQYPDPLYTSLRARLAAFHAVELRRIVIGGSSSELIHRLTQHASRSGAKAVALPSHHYGDYAQAARVWGLEQQMHGELHWLCEPSSPLGQPDLAGEGGRWQVLDCAYRPLWLEGEPPWRDMDGLWQLWTPNKALGLTGVRAAYAIAPLHAPDQELGALRELAPSWVVGAHGVAMLEAWTMDEVQQWLAASLQTLRGWKRQQLALCERLGWRVAPGHLANYFVARLPLDEEAVQQRLGCLRAQGVKLRDCASFGLLGAVRLGVLPPASQAALERAWKEMES
ncbi:aspartate aminotransferase [Comamonas phosphati]|nr:aspartate aminotransferase [Comamonas phosphati]